MPRDMAPLAFEWRRYYQVSRLRFAYMRALVDARESFIGDDDDYTSSLAHSASAILYIVYFVSRHLARTFSS